MSLTFEPILTPVAWVTLAILSIVLWGWYVVRRPISCSRIAWTIVSVLTAVAIVIVLSVLLNPVWLEALPPPAGKPLLTILVDQSESMGTRDDDDVQSRWESATAAVASVGTKLQKTFEVRVQRFSNEMMPTSIGELPAQSPAGATTDLAQPILDSLVSDRPQGQAVLLLSDGVHNADADTRKVLDASRMAKTWDAPIYTVTVGGATHIRDISVHVPKSQELVFVGQSLPVTVEVEQRSLVSDRVTVVLESGGKEIASREVRIDPDATTATSFLLTPDEVGLFQYQVKLKPVGGEATADNNSTSFQVRVVDDPVKALVLEGKPYWDAKFLLRMLAEDPSLEVDCMVKVTSNRSLWRRLQLRETEPSDAELAATSESDQQRRVFERTESTEFVTTPTAKLLDFETLRDYQILLLGREAESYLTGDAIENIRRWLSEEGGSLICYRGAPVAEPDRQLARLLPLQWARNSQSNESRFRVQITERGDDLSWLRLGGGETLSKLPSLSTTSNADSIKPLAVVLGRGDQNTTSPVLTYQPYGTGKVVVIEGAGMWRWAFLAPEFQEHDPVYGTLWQSLLRWVLSSGGLMPGEKISLQMDRVTLTEGEPVSAIVLKREDEEIGTLPNVELRNDDGELLQAAQPVPVGAEPGVYQVFLGKLESGHYELTLSGDGETLPGTRKVSFDVRPDLREQLEIAARPDLMSRIAELSDGKVIELNQLSELTDTFEKHLQETRPVQYRRVSAWDRWWVMAAILCVWSCAWALRRANGLI